MNWEVKYLPEVEKDLKQLESTQRNLVKKAIKKVQQNLYGYSKPLGNHSSTNLTGFMIIKLRSAGLRVVYQLLKVENTMLIVVVGVRADEEVYEIAQKRACKHNLI